MNFSPEDTPRVAPLPLLEISMASITAEARAKVDLAKKNVQECEMEMQILKTKIRGLGTDGGDPNSLELAVLKVRDT